MQSALLFVLCCVQVLGYPWQYKQSPIREKLWLVNVILRQMLSKLFPNKLYPQASAHDLTFNIHAC
jgi:hypothetical protein